MNQPLNARGIDACTMLDAADLQAVGLDPQTSADTSDQNVSACTWSSADKGESVGLVINVGLDLDIILGAKDSATELAEMTVGGHPAAREGQVDSRICTVYTEIADRQLASFEFGSSATDRPVRSCEKAERLSTALILRLEARR